MAKQVRVILPDDVHIQVKVSAALAGVSLAAWIADAIAAKLAKPQAKRAQLGKAKP